MRRSLILFALIVVLFVAAINAAAQQINYSEYDRLTRKYVDGRGLVNYAGLKSELPAMKTFIDQISAVSPESQPQL
ncbi:MAG: hypothetical protein ABI977_21305, partial [Acidobacteriota bacterium]